MVSGRRQPVGEREVVGGSLPALRRRAPRAVRDHPASQGTGQPGQDDDDNAPGGDQKGQWRNHQVAGSDQVQEPRQLLNRPQERTLPPGWRSVQPRISGHGEDPVELRLRPRGVGHVGAATEGVEEAQETGVGVDQVGRRCREVPLDLGLAGGDRLQGVHGSRQGRLVALLGQADVGQGAQDGVGVVVGCGGARAGASSPLPLGLRLAYDAYYTPGDTPSTFANLLHVGVLTLDTPCRCAGLRLSASLPTHDLRALGGPQFSLVIDLKSLGSMAAF